MSTITTTQDTNESQARVCQMPDQHPPRPDPVHPRRAVLRQFWSRSMVTLKSEIVDRFMVERTLSNLSLVLETQALEVSPVRSACSFRLCSIDSSSVRTSEIDTALSCSLLACAAVRLVPSIRLDHLVRSVLAWSAVGRPSASVHLRRICLHSICSDF